jgi:Kef-type K+ transport system membrane component KefB
MQKVFLEIAIILIFTKIGSMISKRYKMPQVLGALIAGVIIGPSVLGFVHESENIKLLSELGVIMLMFLAGLETNLAELKKSGISAFFIAIGGILVPLLFGTAGAYIFFSNFWENLFIGVILTATSVSITVQTLNELGKLNTRVGMNILGAAVIDDILGLIIISFVIVLNKASKTAGSVNVASEILVVSGKVLLFCIIAIISISFLSKILDKYAKRVGKSSQLVVFGIAAALIFSALAGYLEIASITGAYVCGLVLSRVTHKEFIEKNVQSISSNFLTPIFFAGVGISVNLMGVKLDLILLSIVMLVIAILGKLIGCGIAARLYGITRRESIQIGVGMISRGEVAIITANLGLQNHIITPGLFIPTLIVVVFTTIVTPILLKISFSSKLK